MSNSTSSTAPKFDAIQGVNFPFRILQGVSRDELDAYCKAGSLCVVNVRAIGRTYFEASIAKATGSAA